MERKKAQSQEIQPVGFVKVDNSPLLQGVIDGRIDNFKSAAIHSPLAGAEFQEGDQKFIYSWGLDYFCGSGVIEKESDRIPSDKEIDWAISHFTSKNLPFMWWSGAEVLKDKGFQFGGFLTGIALDISQKIPEKLTSLPNLRIEIVKTEPEVLQFSEISGEAFGMNAKVVEQVFHLNTALMNQGEQIHFLAYLDEEPVGTATLTLSPRSAGIWNLTTSDKCRKHGIGSLLVYAALSEAKKRQHKQVMAILMPKGLAWGLFAKFGFKEICRFPFYIFGVSADELEK